MSFTDLLKEPNKKSQNNSELFNSLIKFRIGSYPLQDLGLIKDDWIVSVEENLLSELGLEYEEYDAWKNGV